jgi:hypothetical protein
MHFCTYSAGGKKKKKERETQIKCNKHDVGLHTAECFEAYQTKSKL